MSSRSRWIVLGAIVGVVTFLLRFGLDPANPFDVEWLGVTGDRAQHHLGWCFYRLDPWSWPPSRISSLFAPVGTSLGYTDSIPFAAMLLKPLLTATSVEVQYLGPWLLLNHLLQGVFGGAIATRVARVAPLRLLVVVAIALAPPFLFRQMHVALSTHWILLAALFLYLSPGRSALWLFAVVLFAALVHPYLAFMALALAVASFLRGADGSYRLVAVQVAGCVAVALAGLYLGGTLDPQHGASDYGAGGYGYFSANLLAFADSRGFALWMPPLPGRPMQYEGFNYLGPGILALWIAALVHRPSRRRTRDLIRDHRTLMAVLVALGMVAVSNRIMFGSVKVITIGLHESLDTLAAPFRSSGRFLWPVWYVVVLSAARVADGWKDTPRLRSLLLVLVLLQLVDLSPMWARRLDDLDPPPRPIPTDWSIALAGADTLTTYPPLVYAIDHELDSLWLSRIALHHGLPITTGYVARPPRRPVEDYTRALRTRLLSDVVPRPTERVVVAHDSLASLLPALRGRYHVYVVEGYAVACGEAIAGLQSMQESDQP